MTFEQQREGAAECLRLMQHDHRDCAASEWQHHDRFMVLVSYLHGACHRCGIALTVPATVSLVSDSPIERTYARVLAAEQWESMRVSKIPDT